MKSKAKLIPVSVANAELRRFYSFGSEDHVCADSSGCTSPAMIGSSDCLDHNGRVDEAGRVSLGPCTHVPCPLLALPGASLCHTHIRVARFSNGRS